MVGWVRRAPALLRKLFTPRHLGPPVTELWQVLALTLAAGTMIPVGGVLAHFENLRKGHLRADLLAGTVAFGGGALLAAVVLVPDALKHAGPVLLVSAFLSGALAALWGSCAVRRMGITSAVMSSPRPSQESDHAA